MKQKKNKGNIIFPILMVVCLGVMAFSLYKLLTISGEYKKGESEYAILQSYTVEKNLPEKKEPENSEDPVSADGEQVTADQQEESPISVDFASLQRINPDLVGWLYIPVLEVSYPVVQGTDNAYYLHHTFEGNENFAGSIFVEAAVKDPFGPGHTIVYGHSMKNRTMFGKLKDLLPNELYRKDPVFWILTPEKDICYRICNIEYTEADSEIYTLFDEPGEAYLAYLAERMTQSVLPAEELPECTAETSLVTLSTCAAAEGTARLVVQGIAELQP